MKTSAGFEQCYNGQTAVDAHAQIIVAAELTNCAADHGELPRMLDVVTATFGDAPAVALADAGYRSEATLAQLSDSATEVIVALGVKARAGWRSTPTSCRTRPRWRPSCKPPRAGRSTAAAK